MEEESNFHFGWVIVGVCFITLALVYSVWYAFSVFFVALLKEFGWSRSLGAGAFSLFVVISGIVGPFAGKMMASTHPQRVLICGSLLMGTGLILCSFTQTWWHFYLFFSLITAVGLGATGWVPNVTLVQQWFKEKRGMAMGIISAGIGIGILICVPSIQYLILQLGWRITYRIIAVFIPFIVILLAILFVRQPPRLPSHHTDIGILEKTKKDPSVIDEEWVSRSWTIRKALATKPFWLLTSAFLLGSFMIQSVFTHQVAFFIDHGLEPLFASYLVGIVGIVSIGSKVLWGILSDKIRREVLFTGGVICSILGVLWLILFSQIPTPIFPYLYGLFFGLGYAAHAALAPLIAADFFEGQAFGGIFGMVMFFVGIGGASGAWFAGFLFDQTGSYLPVFVVLIGCALVSCLNIWQAAPRKIRRVSGKL
ncbi:MAG: MFS transporter [Deltaproteobacteria bacterium]|nr:MFS transporter [Deltaproteobacteria bacterium]